MGVKRIPMTRKFNDYFDEGEVNLPLRPTLLRLRLSIACLKRSSPDEETPDTLYCSHSMGAFTCSNISFTESVISPPIPSPGMRVT
jgi:hypothetical protein